MKRGKFKKRIDDLVEPFRRVIRVGAKVLPIQPPNGNPIPTKPQAARDTLKHPFNPKIVGDEVEREQARKMVEGTLMEVMA